MVTNKRCGELLLSLIDFGSCVVCEGVQFLNGASPPTALYCKDFCGSPGFCAPEVVLKHSYNPFLVDAWSCGCTLLEIAIGHRAFVDTWQPHFAPELIARPHAFAAGIEQCISEIEWARIADAGLAELVRMMLSVNPKERRGCTVACAHPWVRRGLLEHAPARAAGGASPPRELESESDAPTFTSPTTTTSGASAVANPEAGSPNVGEESTTPGKLSGPSVSGGNGGAVVDLNKGGKLTSKPGPEPESEPKGKATVTTAPGTASNSAVRGAVDSLFTDAIVRNKSNENMRATNSSSELRGENGPVARPLLMDQSEFGAPSSHSASSFGRGGRSVSPVERGDDGAAEEKSGRDSLDDKELYDLAVDSRARGEAAAASILPLSAGGDARELAEPPSDGGSAVVGVGSSGGGGGSLTTVLPVISPTTSPDEGNTRTTGLGRTTERQTADLSPPIEVSLNGFGVETPGCHDNGRDMAQPAASLSPPLAPTPPKTSLTDHRAKRPSPGSVIRVIRQM